MQSKIGDQKNYLSDTWEELWSIYITFEIFVDRSQFDQLVKLLNLIIESNDQIDQHYKKGKTYQPVLIDQWLNQNQIYSN